MKLKSFWVVLRLAGRSTSIYSTHKIHDSLEEAKKEAERLCAKEKSDFAILEALEYVEYPRPDFTWKPFLKEEK